MKKNDERDERRTRKVLVPLATLAVATAVAVGSGATWTSSTSSNVSVSAGNLVHTNSKNGATISLSNLKPGETKSGSLTITNTGSLDAKLSIQETGQSNNFATTGTASDLQLVIKRDGTTVYSGDFGGFAASNEVDITNGDVLDASNTGTTDETVISFAVTLNADAPTGDQGKTAGATYTFVTTPA